MQLHTNALNKLSKLNVFHKFRNYFDCISKLKNVVLIPRDLSIFSHTRFNLDHVTRKRKHVADSLLSRKNESGIRMHTYIDMNVLVVSLTLVVRFEMVMLWIRVFCFENGDFRRPANTVHRTSRSSWRQCSIVGDNNNNSDEHLLLFVTIHTCTIRIIKYCIFMMLFRTIKLSNEINNILYLIYNLL